MATLIGCMMGRRGVYCGAVEVRVSTNMPSAADIHLSRERKGSLLPTQQKGSDEALYNAVTAEIIQCVKDLVLKQHSAQVRHYRNRNSRNSRHQNRAVAAFGYRARKQ